MSERSNDQQPSDQAHPLHLSSTSATAAPPQPSAPQADQRQTSVENELQAAPPLPPLYTVREQQTHSPQATTSAPAPFYPIPSIPSPLGPASHPQDPYPRSDSPRRKFPISAGSAASQANAFKRARTSSPGSEAGATYSAANSDFGDHESPSVQSSTHHAGQQLHRPQQETAYLQSHPMSDTGSSLGGIIDAKALRLDDPTPPPESAMASPSLRTAAGTAPTQNAPSVAEQNGSIKELMKQPLAAGDTWYLVSTIWFKKWAALCDSASETPGSEAQGLHNVGPIDNSGLLAIDSDHSVGQPSLAPDCREGVHFELVPAEAWNFLASWYGVSGPVFPRHCVLGPDGHNVTLELYVPMISFTRLASPATGQKALDIPIAIISRATPLLEVRQRAMVELQIKVDSEADVRLWTLPDNVPSVSELDAREAQAAEGYETVEETMLSEQLAALLTRPPGQVQAFGVEVKGSDGIWPSDRVEAQAPAKANVRNIFAQTGGDSFSKLQQSAPVAIPEPQTTMTAPRAMTTRSKTAGERSTGVVLGLKGLSNMGNTCFMNSALQCLSNTPELRDYFVSKVFEDEINVDNPLGNKGALAEAFGHLIQQLWSGFGTSFQPRDFKWSLARFAPQFSGYAQQDTQELLAFLLDGLHEDLNRIKKKPYIESPDWHGGGLKEMVKFAKKQWEIYKARNDSVIVDLFQGQYRSTLVCPECSKVSIKFDPFMYLTLPLPSKAKWKHKVTFVPYDPQSPIKTINMTLSYESSISKLKQVIGEVTGVNAKRLIGAEPYNRKFWRFFYDYEPVHVIEKADFVFFWELPADFCLSPPRTKGQHRNFSEPRPIDPPSLENRAFASLMSEHEKDEHVVLPVFTQVPNESAPRGLPFFVSIPKDKANDLRAIHRAVLTQYSRYSPNAAELAATFEPSRGSSDAARAPPADSASHDATGNGNWEMIDAQRKPLNETAGDTFAEITPNGDVIETSASRSSSQEAAAAVGPSIIEELPQALLPAYEILYMVVPPGSTKPLLSDGTAWEDASEGLLQRAERLGAQAANTGEADAPPSSPSVPLVYTGGALVCVWNRGAAEDLLSASPHEHEWGESREEVDDPQTTQDKIAATQKRKGKDVLHIDDCLDEFTKEEKLGEEDPWYCPQCKDFRQATKKFDLWKVPDILVVHLKRFSAGRGLRDKIETVVDFPIEGLDLTARVEAAKAVKQLDEEGAAGMSEDSSSSGSSGSASPAAADGLAAPEDLSASILSAISQANDDAVTSDKPIYDLFAVDNHFGGLGGGHYTASARNDIDGKWHYFDDSHVREIRDPEEVKTSAAYLLFYRRRTTRAIGGKTREIVKTARAKEEAAAAQRPPAFDAPYDGDETMKVTVEDYPSSSNAGPSSLAGIQASSIYRATGGNPSSRTLDSDDAEDAPRAPLGWARDSHQMPGSFNTYSPGSSPSPDDSNSYEPYEKDDTPPESFGGAAPAAGAYHGPSIRPGVRGGRRTQWVDSDDEEPNAIYRGVGMQQGSSSSSNGSANDSGSGSGSGSGGTALFGPASRLQQPPRYTPRATDVDDDEYDDAEADSPLATFTPEAGVGGDESIASDEAEADVSSEEEGGAISSDGEVAPPSVGRGGGIVGFNDDEQQQGEMHQLGAKGVQGGEPQERLNWTS